MEHRDENRLVADVTSTIRKPWNAPVLNQVDVAGNTYGPNNATYDDPSYNNSVS